MKAAQIHQKISIAASPLSLRPLVYNPVAAQVRESRLLQAPKAPRLRVCYANNVDKVGSPAEKPELEEAHGPFHSVSQIAQVAFKLVLDAWSLVQKLFESLQRVRLAAAAIQASADSRSLEEEISSTTAASSSLSKAAPFQLLSAATAGAVTHLCQTLTDDSGTLEVKWRALESTARQQMGYLFNVTQASAQALEALQASSGDAAERLWNQQSAAAVVEEEEALKRQVFAQVFAELNAQAKRDGSNFVGYSAA